MSVTLSPPTPLDDRTWLLTWSGTGSTFTVYRDGELVATTPVPELVVYVDPAETPVFEILDDADAAPQAAFPARLTLGWYAVTGTASYLVEELIAGTWTQRADIEDTGRGFLVWRTRALEDAAAHQFRVVAVGDDGNRGTATSLACLMVRHPDPQAVAYTWTAADRTLTLGAA